MPHTPGPWTVQGILQNTGSVTIGAPKYRIIVADVHNAAGFSDMLTSAMRRGGGRLDPNDADTQFANARLIAAAPDLLAALEALLPEGWGDDDTMDHMPGVKLARAAIAKVRGVPCPAR